MLAVSMTTSVFFANMAWAFLGVNWLVEGDFRSKWQRMRSSTLLHAFVVLMLIHLLWLVGNDDVRLGLDDIRQKLPLLVVPLVVLTSKPLTRRQLCGLAGAYLITVTVVSLIGLVRFLTIPDLPYRQIVPYLSHIRFGLNLCFAICLTLCLTVYGCARTSHCFWLWLVAVLLMGWYLCFLFLLQSYTALLILLLLVCALPLLVRPRSRGLRWTLWCVPVLTVSGMILLTKGMTDSYYGDCRRDADMVENGSYIYRGVDSLSIAAGWGTLSRQPLDAPTDNGYSTYSTLLRYLNATHRSKDSVGVATLTPSDLTAIRQGVANPVYLSHPSLRKMAYMALFEYENYRCGDYRDFSMLERLVLWRNAWRVFLQHPWLGVGTGDVSAECGQQLATDGVIQVDSTKSAHNQYLIFLVAFGVIGMLLIVFFFVRAVVTTDALHMPLAWAYISIVLLSFVSENTLGTLAGCLFAVCPLVLLAQWSRPVSQQDNSPESTECKESISTED